MVVSQQVVDSQAVDHLHPADDQINSHQTKDQDHPGHLDHRDQPTNTFPLSKISDQAEMVASTLNPATITKHSQFVKTQPSN